MRAVETTGPSEFSASSRLGGVGDVRVACGRGDGALESRDLRAEGYSNTLGAVLFNAVSMRPVGRSAAANLLGIVPLTRTFHFTPIYQPHRNQFVIQIAMREWAGWNSCDSPDSSHLLKT